MFGWIKKKTLKASTDAMKNDIERFILSLEGADEEEIATMLVIANIMRLNITKMGTLPSAALDFNIPRDDYIIRQCDMCPIALISLIKQFQKINQPSDALGVMILLHSVRALNVPEIRALGRDMWKQLERGFPHVQDAIFEIRKVSDNNIPQEINSELRFIPRGLEPRT